MTIEPGCIVHSARSGAVAWTVLGVCADWAWISTDPEKMPAMERIERLTLVAPAPPPDHDGELTRLAAVAHAAGVERWFEDEAGICIGDDCLAQISPPDAHLGQDEAELPESVRAILVAKHAFIATFDPPTVLKLIEAVRRASAARPEPQSPKSPNQKEKTS